MSLQTLFKVGGLSDETASFVAVTNSSCFNKVLIEPKEKQGWSQGH